MPFFQKKFLFLIFNARRKDKASGGNHELKFSTLDCLQRHCSYALNLKLQWEKIFEKGRDFNPFPRKKNSSDTNYFLEYS